MFVYMTTTNEGSDSKRMKYFGLDLSGAQEAVGEMMRYPQPLEDVQLRQFPHIFVALPESVDFDWRFVGWYAADGWWASVIEIDMNETTSVKPKEQ